MGLVGKLVLPGIVNNPVESTMMRPVFGSCLITKVYAPGGTIPPLSSVIICAVVY